MKFTCTKEELDRQLQQVSRVVSIRNSLPILSNLLLETDQDCVRISGTDMELAMATKVKATVEQEGVFTVPAKVFQEFVHQNPDGELTFKLEGVELVCTSSKVQARITGMDPEEYPELPSVPEKQVLSLPAAPFIDAVKKVVIAAATDVARPVLTGILLSAEGSLLTLVATDSFRLVERTITSTPVAEKQELLVPARTVQELVRICSQLPDVQTIDLLVSDNQLVFRVDGIELYSRLLAGKFPAYQAIIPTTFLVEADVTTVELLQGLRLATIFSTAGIANVMVEIDETGVFTISSYGSQKGSAKHTLYAVLKEGYQPVRAAFNARFLLDAINAVSTDFVTLKFSGSTSPLVIGGEDPQYLQLVQALRLDA